MQLLYTFFYRQFGIRRVQGLLSPKTFEFNSFPRNSLLHHLTHDADTPDIDPSKLYFSHFNKRILVDYPEELKDSKGNPRKKAVLLKTLFRPFHIQNKLFKYMKDHYLHVNDQLSLLVNNYNYLDVAYRYVDLPMTNYYRWWNDQKTVWTTIEEISKRVDRNHFIFVDVPKELPAYSLLRVYSDQTNITMLKIFDTPSKLFILDIWKWLSKDFRATSTMADISPEHFSKINLVFTNVSGKSTVINLGYLNSWIKGSENVTEFTTITQFENNQIQKIFLKFLMTMQNTVIDEIPIIEPISIPGGKQDDLDKLEDKELRDGSTEYDEEHGEDPLELNSDNNYDDSGQSDLSSFLTAKKNQTDSLKADISNSELKKATDKDLSLNQMFLDIDEDIAALDKINKSMLKERGIHISETGDELKAPHIEELPLEVIQAKVYNSQDYESTLMQQVNEFAEFGLLSASDYKKTIKDIENYKTLEDPYGSKQLVVNKMIVTPEDIALDTNKISIASSNLVTDKSMNESSLLSFDYDYLTKVIEKDTLAMVSNLQKAGIVIKNHEVEIDRSALGEYEHHTLELKPIDGVASTVHFRIPKVNEDGSFTANGNKYVMRKQRVDCPLRKINPYTVALTSYYGKTFVALSQKKANSSLEWIIKQVNKASMEDEAFITKVAPAMVFDNNFVAPYIYNAIANNFKSFTAGNVSLIFDHTERVKLFVDPIDGSKGTSALDQLTAIEKKYDGIVAGHNNKNELVVIGNDDIFYLISKDVKIPLGNIFQVLQLTQASAPVDFTEVRVFSKTVPVGIILGYNIGFRNLLKLLGVKYRIVEGRKNKGLLDSEYAITFADESYVFPRNDKVSSMILGGFLEYEKQLKHFSTDEFDGKDVYLNLLNSKGLTSIYIREMDLTDQLFVDPITKSILEDMGEPTTFRGLLIRATEMLQTYHHPDSQDMSVMRVRGYERIPGVIYKELASSIRQYRNKNISGKSKVDISPYQVWQTIMRDPAIKLIEDINPIQNLKESEVVTYVGEGGRSKEAMNRASRAFHVNDLGVVSEATVDSTDVGINAYLSANPNFKNMRGISKTDKSFNPANMVSTSTLLAPGSSHDD